MADRDRLSALDAAFLALDTTDAPLHIGWTMRLAGRAPTLAALRRHLDARLDRVPRFRRIVAAPALSAGERVWVDDPSFDVAHHVHAMALAAPAGRAELRALAGTLLSTPLTPRRPLWRMSIVNGLTDGGFAVIGQVHHALVDGMAALEVAALLFDAEPHPPASRGTKVWRPQPGGTTLGLAGARLVAGSASRAARGLARAASVRGESLEHAAGALASVARPAPATSLDRTAGPRRAVAYADASLEGVRAAAGTVPDATVNDVLLAAAGSALGAALHRRGEHPATLKALVPVDVRDATDRQLGNAISFMFVDLPLGEPDPVRALTIVARQTAAAKRDGSAAIGAVTRGADALPGIGRSALVRLLARAAPFNVVVSNVRGPEAPMYLLGRRVEAIFPAVPILEGHGLTVGALSYRGRLTVGVYADAAVVPDAVEVARDVESALDALRAAAGPAAPAITPWRRRARERRGAQRARR